MPLSELDKHYISRVCNRCGKTFGEHIHSGDFCPKIHNGEVVPGIYTNQTFQHVAMTEGNSTLFGNA